MVIGELLQYLREAILNDRTDRVSGTSDYLWTDQTLLTNINEAHRRFARKGLVLRDGATPAVTQFLLVAGQEYYDLHPSVIAVLSARRADQGTDLTRVGHSLLGVYRAPTDTWVDPQTYYGNPPGPTLAYSTDEELSVDVEGAMASVVMRVYPTPTIKEQGKVIQLRVVRNPLVKFTAAHLELPLDEQPGPEIAEDHHIEMLDWAAYLALRIVDDDAGAPRRAAEFAANFEEHVKAARLLAMRKLFTPQQWGFGRGGFTWGS